MLEELNEQEFNQFSEKYTNNSFFQSSYWGDLKESTGWKKHLVGIKDNGKIKCASLLLSKKIPILKKNMFYAPRGFLIDYQNLEEVKQFTEKIKTYVKQCKGIFFKMNPYIEYQERNVDGKIVKEGVNNKKLVDFLKKIGYQHNGFTIHYGKDLEPRWISVLDIKNKTEEQVFDHFRSSHKRKIKKSLGDWLTLEVITSKEHEKMEIYKNMMNHTSDRRGFIDRPIQYYKKMYDVFSKGDHIQIILVKLDLEKYQNHLLEEKNKLKERLEKLCSKKETEKIEIEKQMVHIEMNDKEISELIQTEGKQIYITTGLFLQFGNQLTYLFGGSYDKYLKYFGAYYMQWKMIQYAIKNGYEIYNFYGITGEFNENSPMYGLFDFKRGFQAKVVELIGEFTYVVDKPYYYAYNVMFKAYKKIKKWRVKK